MTMRSEKRKELGSFRLFVFSILGAIAFAFGVEPKSEIKRDAKAKVTFVELGSVKCIPCKAMKKIMDVLEEKYPKDLAIVFHDVWTEEGKPAASEYKIRSIPTQVFLNENGVEFFRHEGYFPQDELEKVLHGNGVTK